MPHSHSECALFANVPALSPAQVLEQFGSERTGGCFHIVNIWLIRLTRGLFVLVNNKYVDNTLKEILVLVYSGSIVNNRPKTGGIYTMCIQSLLHFTKLVLSAFNYLFMCLKLMNEWQTVAFWQHS